MKTIIFTDGSSRGNPGPGGWGAIVISGGSHVVELGGREDNTTNNRMELTAVIQSLSKTVSEDDVIVYTDSSYVINGITKWVHGWQKNNWQTKTKEDVLNRDLWESLVRMSNGKKIDWTYVGGHVGVAGNERCDEIATMFADEEAVDLFDGKVSDYSIKNIFDVSLDESAQTKKSSKKSRSNAPAYSYVSMIDGKIATHSTWAECEARVKGKSGARFKKALSAEEEKSIFAEFHGK